MCTSVNIILAFFCRRTHHTLHTVQYSYHMRIDTQILSDFDTGRYKLELFYNLEPKKDKFG